MDATTLTYNQLISVLRSLGFAEHPGESGAMRPRAFVHQATDTLLLLRNTGEEPVTAADLLSVEMRLDAKGITSQSLSALAGSTTVGK